MAITQIITVLPDPPSRSDPANFDTRADNFLGALPDMQTQMNTWAEQANVLASEAAGVTGAAEAAQAAAEDAEAGAIAAQGTATTQAGIATTQAGIATTQASTATTKAGESAASAVTASTQAGIATTQASTATAQAGIATTKAGEAAASAVTATTQAGTATTQAGIATTQAGIATTQAGTATTQASEASASAVTATTQAGIATTQASTATTKAGESAASAVTASTQAGIATTQASTATAQAGIATTKAGEAAASAVTATTQAGTATTQAGIATTQAGIATTQAGTATTQASEASASAVTATTQAGTATTQAGIATTQSGTATTQAGIATTQAGIATTQAGIATTQAGIATAAAQAAVNTVTGDMATLDPAAGKIPLADGAGKIAAGWLPISTDYAPAAQGVTNGDSHDHSGGDGAQLAYANLSGLPTLGTAAATASTDYAPAAHVGATGAAHGDATTSAAGFLSGTDKTKLDGIATGATANTGTVTSVGLSLPTEFEVSDSPVTASGTLTATKASQAANQVYAAPNGSAGMPVFRALVAADIPALDQTYQPLDTDLTAIAALSTTGLIERTGAGTAGIVTVTAAGKALLDDADAAAQRTTLGLGTAAATASTDYATAAQGGTADTALQPTDVDDTPADGATTAPISSHWAFAHLAKLHAPDNAIGAPGAMGFGVGICPSLPAGFAPLSGTFDAASDNYGNYRYADGSIMCWIPAFYYRVAHASNPTYGTYGVNSVDVKPYSHFGNVAAANTAGYALHRAFYDGTEQPGFFIDKYLGSNSLGANASGGTFSSLALGIPCDTDGSQSGVGAIAGCGGTNNYGMVQTACRSRGATFHSASLFMHKALALLALAHAQAATATTWCAWYDAAGTTNFPKGCNNNALGDAHDASVAYLTAGHGTYPNKPLTGSATAPAKVAHNGQGSGVMDLNGAMWEVAYGLTSDATNYYGLKPSKRLRGLTGANTTGADSLFGATGIAANYDDYGTSIGVVGGSEAATFFGSASQVLAADTSGEGWFATGAGIPLAEGGSNLFGNDGLWDYRPNELCPVVGANRAGGSNAGVWALDLGRVRGSASYGVGGRAALFL